MQINLFPTPISMFHIENEQFTSISETVNKYIEDNYNNFDNSWTKSNTLSSYNYGKDNKLPDIYYNEQLENAILVASKGYLEENKFPVKELLIKDLWINVSTKGSFQEVHCHTTRDNVLSGIIYINVEDTESKTNFLNPNKKFKTICEDTVLAKDCELNVHSGVIVVFPSFLEHYVSENKTGNKRITVAFNLSYK